MRRKNASPSTKRAPIPASSLLHRTYKLLDKSVRAALADGRSKSAVLAQIGRQSDVGLEWLRKLERREIEDPGVLKIERVFAHLDAARKPLPVYGPEPKPRPGAEVVVPTPPPRIVSVC